MLTFRIAADLKHKKRTPDHKVRSSFAAICNITDVCDFLQLQNRGCIFGVSSEQIGVSTDNFGAINRALRLPECEDPPSANAAFLRRFRDARRR